MNNESYRILTSVYAVATVRHRKGLYQLGQPVIATPFATFRGIVDYRLGRADTGEEIGLITANQFRNHFQELL